MLFLLNKSTNVEVHSWQFASYKFFLIKCVLLLISHKKKSIKVNSFTVFKLNKCERKLNFFSTRHQQCWLLNAKFPLNITLIVLLGKFHNFLLFITQNDEPSLFMEMNNLNKCDEILTRKFFLIKKKRRWIN